MEQVFKELVAIVGEKWVSRATEERFIYSRDPGTMAPAAPDLVVMPATTEEVSQILRLAHRRKVPVTPMGGGLTLSGICRPLKGGIVLDMKRMNRILEVNETSSYAVVEAGVSQGILQAYLKKHHPRLKHSVPDAPPIATLAGNVLIHGSGHLSALGGFHSEMLTGLEVVLPTGEVVRAGSCSVSPYWFSRAPLQDLAGLFLGWHGTTGVATKLGIKLYPARAQNDVLVFVLEDAEMAPDIIHRFGRTQVAEDILAMMAPKPEWVRGFQMVSINYGADSQKELRLKRDLLIEAVRPYLDRKIGGFMPLPSEMKGRFLEAPQSSLAVFADVNKGGGFEYVGAIMPLELFPQAYRQGVEIAEKKGVTYSLGARVIGFGHCMMFFYAYAFNRADAADIKRAQEALEETNVAVLNLGGIPWKAEEPAQKQILKRMDPNSAALLARVRGLLDPQGIMNPGNWEV
jgi:glycolate oxidase